MNKGLRIVSQFLGNVSVRGKEVLKNWDAFLNAFSLKIWGHSTSNSGLSRGLRRQKIYRGVGFVSVCGLMLLTVATVFPLYSVAEYSEAAAGTAQDSEITFTATRSTASVDLTVTSENGTFASSTSSNQAAFSLSTTNFTGYTLTIASNNNTSALTNANGGSLSSISSPIDESTFNTTTYNNKWGYKPNYYASSVNTNYLPSPTTIADTLDETDAANTTAKNYTIALGARADYTNTSGTYSSSNYKLMYVANPVAYSISFDKGSAADDPSNMPAVVTGSVSTMTVDLPSTIPTRTAYDFIGWCLGTITTTDNEDSCTGTGAKTFTAGSDFGIDRTTTNIVTLHAMWSIKTYTLTIINDGNASVSDSGTYRYGETVTLNATPNTSTTCTSYSTPIWSKTSGEGTLNSTSGTSVTFTMGAGDAAITVSSTASDIPQTITLSRSTGASGINIAGTNYTGSSVSLNCGTYNISGNYDSNYEFSSWEAANNVTVASTSSTSTTMTVSGAGTLTLNAKSSCQTSVNGTMQAFNPCSSIAIGTKGTLTDSRGSTTKSYTVAKLADGKWWMTSNLDLPGGTKLTSSDSDVTSEYNLPSSSSSPAFSSDTAKVYNSGSTDCSADKGCYSYYSYYAATAGTGSSVSSYNNASGSICPKGWRLPTATTSNAQADVNNKNNWKTGDFYPLATAYGADLESSYFQSSGTFYTNAGPGTTPNFLLSGYFKGTSFTNGGSRGLYWSSTMSYAPYSKAYSLSFSSVNIHSAYSDGRYLGYAVRCVYAG